MKGVFARYDLKHIQGLGIAMFKPRVLRLWVTRSLTHFKHGGFDNSNRVLRTCDNFVPLWGYHFAFSQTSRVDPFGFRVCNLAVEA